MSSSLQYPTLDAAIAQAEGFNTPGTIAANQHNPGNLVYNDYTKSLGATGAGSKGIAIFPDDQTGLSAEDSLVSTYAAKGLTIDQLSENWAPATAPGNDANTPSTWASNVASYLGVSGSTPTQALAGQSQGPGVTGKIKDLASGVLQNAFPSGADIGKLAGAANSTIATLFGISISQFGAFVLGLIIIAGAIFLFKPVQNIAVKAGRGAIAAI